jgi:hypothetical protein
MAQHPDPDLLTPDIIKKMIGKSLEITAPKAAPIEMVAPRILGNSTDPDLKLCEEILSELMRDVIVFAQDLVQVRLNPSVKSKLHFGEGRPPTRQK